MCITNYNSYASKDSITVDYMVIGGRHSAVIRLVEIPCSCVVALESYQVIINCVLSIDSPP